MLEVNYLLCLASLLVFVFLFIRLKKYDLNFIFLGFCCFLLFLLPTFLMPNNQFYDHRIYLPLVGIIIVLSEFFREYINLKKLMYCSLIVLIIFSCIVLFYEDKFQSKEVFWVNALISSPESDVANAMVAGLFFERGMYKEAEERYLKAISLKEFSKHYVNLSALYARIGRLDDAEKVLLKALNLSQDNPTAYYNLALVYKYKNDIDKAKEMKDKYIEIFNKTNKVSKIDDIIL